MQNKQTSIRFKRACCLVFCELSREKRLCLFYARLRSATQHLLQGQNTYFQALPRIHSAFCGDQAAIVAFVMPSVNEQNTSLAVYFNCTFYAEALNICLDGNSSIHCSFPMCGWEFCCCGFSNETKSGRANYRTFFCFVLTRKRTNPPQCTRLPRRSTAE